MPLNRTELQEIRFLNWFKLISFVFWQAQLETCFAFPKGIKQMLLSFPIVFETITHLARKYTATIKKPNPGLTCRCHQRGEWRGAERPVIPFSTEIMDFLQSTKESLVDSFCSQFFWFQWVELFYMRDFPPRPHTKAKSFYYLFISFKQFLSYQCTVIV